MALNRTLRLRKNSDFQRVRQQGRTTASRLLVLAYAPSEQNTPRIGFVVSKRVSKHAVTRNYIKRQLSEALRTVLSDIPAGWDLVFSAKSSIVGVHLSVLLHDVCMLLRRARLLVHSQTVDTRSLQ